LFLNSVRSSIIGKARAIVGLLYNLDSCSCDDDKHSTVRHQLSDDGFIWILEDREKSYDVGYRYFSWISIFEIDTRIQDVASAFRAEEIPHFLHLCFFERIRKGERWPRASTIGFVRPSCHLS
jgi:hypothetical protein